MQAEFKQIEQEDGVARQDLELKFEKIKVERLADYQDRLRNAGGSKDF